MLRTEVVDINKVFQSNLSHKHYIYVPFINSEIKQHNSLVIVCDK